MTQEIAMFVLSLILLVFSLAVYIIGTWKHFQWSLKKAAGMGLLLRLGSFILSGMLTNALPIVLPHNWFWLQSVVVYSILVTTAYIAVVAAIRIAIEWAICRFAAVPVSSLRTLAVVAAMYAIATVPSSIIDFCMTRPSFGPPFSFVPRAEWLSGDTPMVYISMRQRVLARTTLGSTNEILVSTALPAAGYRISTDATRLAVCDSSSTVMFAYAPCPTGPVRELSVPLPYPHPRRAAFSPDARWCATLDGDLVHVRSFPDGAPTASVRVASLASNSFLAWSSDATYLVCGTSASAFCVNWQTATVVPLTQSLDSAEVTWFFDVTSIQPTASYSRTDAVVTTHATKGISLSSPALTGSFRATAPSTCVGIGFSPDASSFLFYFSFQKPIVEILALNLRTGAIGHLYEGACILFPGVGNRIPPLIPTQ